MPSRVMFCSDLARMDFTGKWAGRIKGWCISEASIKSIGFCNAPDLFENIPYGMRRADVARCYPSFPQAANSGFAITTNQPARRATGLCLELTTGNGQRERHRIEVDLHTRDVQTFQLDQKTKLTGETDEMTAIAIAQATDLPARFQRSLAARPGLTLRLDIINKCNLRCVMCAFSEEAVFKRPMRQLTLDEFKALFNDVGGHVREVVLSCGDEPLTSKYFGDIVRYLAAEHPRAAIIFCTNATLMRATIRKIIIENGVASLLLSIDAVSKQLFETIRAGARYQQVIGNILALRDLKAKCGTKYPRFTFNYVMMNQNIHEAPLFVRMAKMLGGEAVDFRHMVPSTTHYDPNELLSAHPGKFNYYRQQIAAKAQACGIHYYLPAVFETDESWLPESEMDVTLDDFLAVQPDEAGPHLPESTRGANLPALEETWEGSAGEEFSGVFCNRPFSEILVRDQNEVLPCAWYREALGRLDDGKSISEIFFGPKFDALRRNMLLPSGDPGCAGCPIKSGHLPTGN